MKNNRLAFVSRRMATLTLCLMIAMLALNAASWVLPQWMSVKNGYGLTFALSDKLINSFDTDIATFAWWQVLGGIAISSVPLCSLVWGLQHLRRLFEEFAQDEHFSTMAAQHMGNVGHAVSLWVLLNFICEPLLTLWITMREEVGHRVIAFGFDASGVVALFLAGCITVIARILWLAAQLRLENQQFI